MKVKLTSACLRLGIGARSGQTAKMQSQCGELAFSVPIPNVREYPRPECLRGRGCHQAWRSACAAPRVTTMFWARLQPTTWLTGRCIALAHYCFWNELLDPTDDRAVPPLQRAPLLPRRAIHAVPFPLRFLLAFAYHLSAFAAKRSKQRRHEVVLFVLPHACATES